ncbi:MAG: hypothetical protein ABIH85_00145 [Candidatus Omnitrophota bacterium]
MNIKRINIKQIIAREGLIFLAVIIFAFGLMGCSNYDNGYEDGSSGGRKSGFGTKYSKGYEAGAEAFGMYNLGYYDANNDNRPRYQNDVDYMNGYKEGQ